MQRKQIYLSSKQCRELARLASQIGANTSELIRRAVDRFVEAQEKEHKDKKKRDAEFLKMLNSFSPSWRKRDLKEFEETRRSLDRVFPGWND